MENTSFEDILPSFTLNDAPFLSDKPIHSIYETYLGNMDSLQNLTLPSDTPAATSSSSSSSYYSCSSSSASSTYSYSACSSPYPSFDGECGLLEEMEAFSRMDVWDWRGEDSLDWAGSVCRRRGLDSHVIDLTPFRATPGNYLQKLTQNEFIDLIGDVYGPVFYAEFQELCQKREEGKKWRRHHNTGGSSPYSECGGDFDLDLGGDIFLGDLAMTSEEKRSLDIYMVDTPLVDGLQDMDLEGSGPICYDSLDSCPEPVAQLSAASSPSSSSSFSHLPPFSSSSTSSSSSSSNASSSSNNLALPDPLKKIRADPKKRERGPRNWEFVIRLLADPRTNPSLIRWEQKDQGVFRLVQPAAIASMWGKRSDRPNLSYDNFARGLRYHYTTGALQPVSEKQLVYRCGPKAVKYLIELSRGSSK